jgi:hypothetical protein
MVSPRLFFRGVLCGRRDFFVIYCSPNLALVTYESRSDSTDRKGHLTGASLLVHPVKTNDLVRHSSSLIASFFIANFVILITSYVIISFYRHEFYSCRLEKNTKN